MVSVEPAPGDRSDQLKGYLMVGGSALMFGSAGVFIRISTMPASMLLVLRMALGAALVAVFLVRSRWWREWLVPGVPLRLFLLGVIDAVQLLTFFLAVRYMDVALAVFLSYMSPIYIALVAPRLFRQRTEPVVVVALILSAGGIAAMLVPGLLDPSLRVSALGLVCGLLAGVLLAVFFLLAKGLRSKVGGGTMLISDGLTTAVVLLPLGLIQWIPAGMPFTAGDLWAVIGLAVICTAVGGTIFLQGMRHIRVQHTSIVGLLEPASAPLFAFMFLGEVPAVWTLVGGALILAGAVLVVLFGGSQEGMAGSPEEVLAEVEALP